MLRRLSRVSFSCFISPPPQLSVTSDSICVKQTLRLTSRLREGTQITRKQPAKSHASKHVWLYRTTGQQERRNRVFFFKVAFFLGHIKRRALTIRFGWLCQRCPAWPFHPHCAWCGALSSSASKRARGAAGERNLTPDCFRALSHL